MSIKKCGCTTLTGNNRTRRIHMAPIIPAGGKKMDWVRGPEQLVAKKAQDMFEDDPQLSAIKDLPGMSDGIAELQGMTDECPNMDAPPCDSGLDTPAAGGSVEKAVKKVEDAAREVADAAIADAEKAVTDAIKNVGKVPAASPVSDKVDEICPDIGKDHEDSETPAEEAKEEPEKSETDEEEESKDDIPGLDGEKGGKAKKEGDEDEKPAFAASLVGMKRIADLSASEAKELKAYWKDSLGLPSEYVDAMLKKYTA